MFIVQPKNAEELGRLELTKDDVMQSLEMLDSMPLTSDMTVKRRFKAAESECPSLWITFTFGKFSLLKIYHLRLIPGGRIVSLQT